MKEKIKTADFHRLKDMCLKAARRKYGYRLPVAIRRRLTGEFREICQLDAAAFYLTAADLAGTLREKGIMFYIDSPATSTLTAYLTGLTEIDPLPPHYSCPVCGRTSFISEEKDGRLLYPSMGETEPRACSICGTMDRGSGFDIPDGLAHAGEGIPKKTVPSQDLCAGGQDGRSHGDCPGRTFTKMGRRIPSYRFHIFRQYHGSYHADGKGQRTRP